ncbi:MAG: UDP-N-acetylmuramoyl-tripeptide--D-alanyl-D-alanine ligase [Magnetococcales bacterium]|nr:UDP-N-acetylmuramoyl-tripeptide--D-alanyl-D-alanine ligase [Magnetococcales bacterium]
MSLTLSLFGKVAVDLPLAGVSIDSRTVRPGELFAAVRGERFDGHDFIDKAVAAGCAALLLERPPSTPPAVPVLQVEDVLHTLGEAAQRWREQVNPLVLAVTGSCGKTTVKEMLTRSLQQHFAVVHATRGNFNNHIGLPLTLLAMPAHCQALVVELGMSGAGEIAYLARLAKPQIGVVTNVLPAHLEAFDSVEAIVEAKGELLEALPAHGMAVIPHGQSYTARLRQKAGSVKVLTFGPDPAADLFIGRVGEESDTSPPAHTFVIHWQGEPDGIKICLAAPGEHLRQNVLAVAAAARAAGLSPQQIASGLELFAPPVGRGGICQSSAGWRVVDDSYNANPGSVQAALYALPKPDKPGRRVAVLGDMLELGKEAELLHRGLCQAVRESGVTLLLTAGPQMQALHQAVKEVGWEGAKGQQGDGPIEAWHRPDPAQWLPDIKTYLRPEDVILVKGSRGMKMERIVKLLLAEQ